MLKEGDGYIHLGSPVDFDMTTTQERNVGQVISFFPVHHQDKGQVRIQCDGMKMEIPVRLGCL